MSYSYISGSTGGIGKAFAVECAKLGYDLFLTGRSEEKLSLLKAELNKINYKIKIEYQPCQLTDQADRQKMLEYIDSKNIKFDRIINVAGVDTQKPFMDYTADKVQFQIRVNVESTITLTHELLLRRDNLNYQNNNDKNAKKTEVITISSMSGVTPMPYFALYSATKSCLTSFFMSLRLELKNKGVFVTTVLPGGVPTRPDIINDIKGQGLWGKLSSKSPKYVAKGALKAVKKNKKKYIPGGFNKFLNFIMKLAPLSISMKFIAKRWSKISKDAF